MYIVQRRVNITHATAIQRIGDNSSCLSRYDCSFPVKRIQYVCTSFAQTVVSDVAVAKSTALVASSA